MLAQAAGGYNLHLDYDDPANRPAVTTRISIYECPSSPSGHIVTPNPGFEPAVGDYMAVTRSSGVASVWTTFGMVFPGTDACDAILKSNKRTLITTIPDGLSNTLMIGESGADTRAGSVAGSMRTSPTIRVIALEPGESAAAWAANSNNIVCGGTRSDANAAVHGLRQSERQANPTGQQVRRTLLPPSLLTAGIRANSIPSIPALLTSAWATVPFAHSRTRSTLCSDPHGGCRRRLSSQSGSVID